MTDSFEKMGGSFKLNPFRLDIQNGLKRSNPLDQGKSGSNWASQAQTLSVAEMGSTYGGPTRSTLSAQSSSNTSARTNVVAGSVRGGDFGRTSNMESAQNSTAKLLDANRRGSMLLGVSVRIHLHGGRNGDPKQESNTGRPPPAMSAQNLLARNFVVVQRESETTYQICKTARIESLEFPYC